MERKTLSVALIVLPFLLFSCGTEKSDYEKTKQANNIQMYQEFIQKHPRGKFAESAKATLDSLTYQMTVSKNKLEDYEEFVKSYPESKYYSTAVRRLEELYFERAQTEETIPAFREFLEKYPEGIYASSAKARLRELQLTKTYDGFEITVKSVERKKKLIWNKDFEQETKEGYEFAVVLLKIKWSNTKQQFCIENPSDVVILDAYGKKYNTIINLRMSASIDHVEIPFVVPTNIKYKTLRIKNVEFGFENLEK